MNKKIRNQNQGFTIIEVLIVLAIAGLIMLIVFLAVPALQRTSRNNARNNDGARIAAAVTECLSNRNGQVDSCNDTPVIESLAGTRTQLTSITVQQLSPGGKETANVVFGNKCTAAGDAVEPGSAREFGVLFQIETANGTLNRCISA